MTDYLDTYLASDLDEAGGYYGFVSRSGAWYIKKVTSTAVRYTKGTKSYATNWTGRADLTYDYFNEVFG